MAKKVGLLALAGVALSGCGEGAGPEAEATEERQGQIVRPTSGGGRDQVVMVFAVAVIDGGLVQRTCTGSYFAPRVVLTAAHCLDGVLADPIQLFVYWGDNFTQEFAQLTREGSLFVAPPVGAPSRWAQADSFETHPSWNPTLIYPDMGVIYLDRRPPFDPLPLARSRIAPNVNVTISGWGANQANGSGGNVQRTGRTITLGSPTAADYHPEDPNPGMLNATVRQNVIKTDGRGPRSNACAGDSGGPIIVNQWGQDYIAGVNYFGGLSCESYALYTRIDPFLPFLDLAYKRGGQDVVRPTFDCVAPNAQGTLTAYFGYRNDNGVAITIPYGTRNALTRDTPGFRPRRFAPGVHAFSFGVDFTAGQNVVWTLSPDNNPTTTLTVNASSTRCTAAQFVSTECAAACRASFRSPCAPLGTFADCSEDCIEFNQFVVDSIPACVTAQSALFSCIATTPPAASNWICFEGGGTQSISCSEQQQTYFDCVFGG